MEAPARFSDYIVYVDESGDHGMQSIDASYPVFVLALCVFHKQHYSEYVVPALHKFKFAHFGHDLSVLHEHEIRKEDNDLELEFRRICAGENQWRCVLPFDVRFASKKVNSAGLQLADLVARPLGLNSLRPEQSNRAFDILKTKLYQSEKPR